MTTGVILGVAIVEWLNSSGVVKTTKHSVAPGIDLALGLIALLAAYVVWSGYLARERARRKRKHGDKPKKTPKWQQTLSKGTARTTFVIGLLLSFPGASYLAALTEIRKHNLATAEIVLVVLAVNIVMLSLLEAPLVAYTVAPDWTPGAVERFKGWIAKNGAKVFVIAMTIIGAALIIPGVVTIVA
jgi:hypothetical protein